MRHALLDGNRIVNIVEIDPRNVSDFPNAVTIPDGVGAGIGDTYEDGRFWRGGCSCRGGTHPGIVGEYVVKG